MSKWADENLRRYKFGTVFWRPLTGPPLVLRDWNFVRNLTRAYLTERKWVDSFSIHFFTGLRRYSIVKTFLSLECPNLYQKDKKKWAHFFLIQHTSASINPSGPHCCFLLLWISIILTWKWLKMMPIHKTKNEQWGPEGLTTNEPIEFRKTTSHFLEWGRWAK